jgi:hypothetical protein
MSTDNLSLLIAFGSFVVSAGSMFIALMALRYTKNSRLEDLRDKNRLLFLESKYFWQWPGNRDEHEHLQLAIANRSPNLVTVKSVCWSISNGQTTWELKQVADNSCVNLPKLLTQSEEVVLNICPHSVFDIVWLNREVSSFEKIAYIDNVRIHVLLTTGHEHFVPLPASYKKSLVMRRVENPVLRVIASFFVSR